MKLKSMTDFVLEQRMTSEEVAKACFFDIQTHIYKYYDKVYAYAQFLKQPLKLEMFVPCDDEGNVLSEPDIYSQWVRENFNDELENEERINQCKDYHQAKEKVLFEGFMNIETRNKGRIYFALKQSHRTGNIDYIMNDAFGLFFYDASNEKSRLNTIEDLLNFSELQLTPTAIKQIQP